MDRSALVNEMGVAAAKIAPIPGLAWLGSAFHDDRAQGAFYTLGAGYVVLQFAHLVWVWRNEKADRGRKASLIRPRVPKNG